jgi:hypothetical protein
MAKLTRDEVFEIAKEEGMTIVSSSNPDEQRVAGIPISTLERWQLEAEEQYENEKASEEDEYLNSLVKGSKGMKTKKTKFKNK